MPEATTEPRPACPTCGTPLPSDAPTVGGRLACPRCLLAAGVPTGGRTADAPSAAEVAAAFPDHEILGLLGRGGMGVVWKARQKGLDRLVALKVLPREVAAVPGFAERFQREARALARLTHPNIVGVHEYGERAGIYFLVLEYVDGTNVRQAMREGRVAPAAALRIVPQICDALQYAHEHGVVHRDIKPENVLLDAAGRVKVTDFGLAKLVGAEGGRADLTVTGQVMGTPHYMAPEQFERPATVDHRADIFSLGVVFYEMLTGELPLGRFDPPSKRVQVDVRLDEVVLRSLEKAPERRWQHAVDVKTEVGTIGATPRVVGPAPAPPEGGPRTARTSVLAVAALTASVASIVPFVLKPLAGRGLAIPLLVMLTALAGFGVVAGIVAWVSIARSRGALRGLPLAVTAVFLPFCVAVIVVPAALWFAGRSKMVADQDEERRVAEAYEVPKVAAPDPPGGPILRGQGALLGVTSAELTAAWDGMLGAARAGDFNALRPCYTGEDWVLIAALPPGERARRAATSVQTDQLGLPAFLYAQKEWIEGLRLVSVGTVDESNKIAVDGTTVSVVRASGAARGPRGQLHFHLRAQVTERPGEPRRVEWTFPIHHVIQTK